MTSTPPRRRPRIALVDNTINTSYVIAKILRQDGYDADYIQQPNAPFNQQPVWEDVDAVASTADVFERRPSDAYFRQIERRYGWERPEWVRRPTLRMSDIPVAVALARSALDAVPPSLAPIVLALNAPSIPVLSALRHHDVVLAIGQGAITALLGGRPYAVITMGWEIYALPFFASSWHPIRRARGTAQRAALDRALAIFGLPAMDAGPLARLGLVDRLRPFPMPVDVDGYAAVRPGDRSDVFGRDVADRLTGKLVCFCPSRLSIAEKHQDRILHAFARIRSEGMPAHLVVLRWGHDAPRIETLIHRLGLDPDVTVMPVVMSKRRLVAAFKSVDIVLDQFGTGTYGGVAREALAAGVPVVSSYDPGVPQPHPPDDPAPMVSADTVERIAAAMRELSDPQRRTAIAARGVEWIRRNHYVAPLQQLSSWLHDVSGVRG